MRDLERQAGIPGSSGPGERNKPYDGIGEPVPQRLQFGIAAEKGCRREWERKPLSSSTAAWSAGTRALLSNASRAAPVRSRAAESARTVSTCGRRRSPRSSALTP
jgi:hypothetical protein